MDGTFPSFDSLSLTASLWLTIIPTIVSIIATIVWPLSLLHLSASTIPFLPALSLPLLLATTIIITVITTTHTEGPETRNKPNVLQVFAIVPYKTR
jgi:hypothetical protein